MPEVLIGHAFCFYVNWILARWNDDEIQKAKRRAKQAAPLRTTDIPILNISIGNFNSSTVRNWQALCLYSAPNLSAIRLSVLGRIVANTGSRGNAMFQGATFLLRCNMRR